MPRNLAFVNNPKGHTHRMDTYRLGSVNRNHVAGPYRAVESDYHHSEITFHVPVNKAYVILRSWWMMPANLPSLSVKGVLGCLVKPWIPPNVVF